MLYESHAWFHSTILICYAGGNWQTLLGFVRTIGMKSQGSSMHEVPEEPDYFFFPFLSPLKNLTQLKGFRNGLVTGMNLSF